MEIRDPIHGPMPVSSAELPVVDHPWLQRLREIRQTGFSHLPFPSATHTRHAHSLGVMHLAGQAFDHAFSRHPLPDAKRAALRACVRVAALCHDLGHPPFSHCTEFAMPPLSALGLTWAPPEADRRATHEDYTLAILERTDLGRTIDENFPFTARHVAALICADVDPGDDFFRSGGLDHQLVCSQLVSSEIDCDRLDYLVRDSYFSGARYGQIDTSWILTSLGTSITADDRVVLALDDRAIYAFDDFLIARHHMFLMIYFHHKSVIYEEMLRRWVGSRDARFVLPADLDEYRTMDDIALEVRLRGSTNPWARRIVGRQPYRRVLERHGRPDEVNLEVACERLFEAGIGHIHAASTGRLSRYAGPKRAHTAPIAVVHRLPGLPAERTRALEGASDVFVRYADERCIARVYVSPEELAAARATIGDLA